MFSSISKLWSGEATSQYSAVDPSNDLPPATSICDLEKGADKRLRSLRHLIKLNHANFALVDEKCSTLNYIPDVLAAAFALGSPLDDLDKLYEQATQDDVVKWIDSPNEVTKLDWAAFLGQNQYQRAFLDFFEDEVVEMGYHWRELTRRYLYFGERPLIQYAMAARGQGITRIANGLSMSSREVTMEGLALLAVSCDASQAAQSTSRSTPDPEEFTSHDPLKILEMVRETKKAEGEAAHSERLVARFSQSWNIESIADGLRHAQLAAAVLSGCGESADNGPGAILNATHGLRTVLVGAPRSHAIAALESWWQEALSVYVKIGCPTLNPGKMQASSGTNDNWEGLAQKVIHQTSNSDWHRDLSTLHTLYSAAQSWPDHDVFLQVAQKLAS